MRNSDSISKISVALLKAQKEIGGAKKGSTNPFFHSKYADLGSVMEACKDALNENGIVVLQPVGTDEIGQYVETVLLHESGEFISDKMRLVAKTENNPQDQGSAISYARRYSLQSMVFIPAEDDDGESAKPVTKYSPEAVTKIVKQIGTNADEDWITNGIPEKKEITILKCVQCGSPLRPEVASYSQKFFKKNLCRPCQDLVKKVNAN